MEKTKKRLGIRISRFYIRIVYLWTEFSVDPAQSQHPGSLKNKEIVNYEKIVKGNYGKCHFVIEFVNQLCYC